MNLFKKYKFFDIMTYSYYILRYEKISKLYYSIIFKIKSKLLNIKVGNGLNVFGHVNIIKFPSSTIILGNNVNIISCNMKSGASPVSVTRLKTFSSSAKIIIGNNVDLNGTSISCRSRTIEIKNNTLIGPNVVITDSDFHCIDPLYRIPGNRKACFESDKDVVIGENVWIGMNTIILKGVIIGDNTIVGAGSVVTKNLEANSIYAGNPIKMIKKL